ncbi:hypothetical protein PTSG_12790 [Salpingoeca rosetta]|uniref:Uncharacterized protein n=1 Tax=Salpingoeca rosetta (strain ATCC 50818 / BSB-021) TaxID=946362 RepID=F2UKM7_SALR5|nr:uncharacterized protein PTSG_12790 [Salpingoeca rosetta]EGD77676.1 hypothetical protein PTSG_12790 [Salpingoeca rosetta]|eukprot:XP_004990152.1 hypothetical protein PTSG_12790 [Salpingoeca rosetta]
MNLQQIMRPSTISADGIKVFAGAEQDANLFFITVEAKLIAAGIDAGIIAEGGADHQGDGQAPAAASSPSPSAHGASGPRTRSRAQRGPRRTGVRHDAGDHDDDDDDEGDGDDHGAQPSSSSSSLPSSATPSGGVQVASPASGLLDPRDPQVDAAIFAFLLGVLTGHPLRLAITDNRGRSGVLALRRLRERYIRSGKDHVSRLRQQLSSTTWLPTDTVDTFMSRITDINSQLLTAGVSIPEDDLRTLVRNELPAEFDVAMRFMEREDPPPSLSKMTADLIQEGRRLHRPKKRTPVLAIGGPGSGSFAASPMHAGTSPSDTSGGPCCPPAERVTCAFCNFRGHCAQQCRKLQAAKRYHVIDSLKDKSPFEALTGHPFDVSLLRVFGSPAYVHVEKSSTRHKLDPRSRVGVYVGFAEEDQAHVVWMPDTRRVVHTIHARFGAIKNKDAASSQQQQEQDNSGASASHANKTAQRSTEDSATGAPTAPRAGEPQIQPRALGGSVWDQLLLSETLGDKDTSGGSTTTCHVATSAAGTGEKTSAVGGHLPDIAAGSVATSAEPATVKEALASPDSEEWRQAILDEFAAMQANDVYDVVPRADLPKGHKLLRSMVIFRRKRDDQGKVIKYKARWVAKGYSQVHGDVGCRLRGRPAHLADSDSDMAAFKKAISKRFKMKDLGSPDICLGIKVQHDHKARTVTMSQEHYLRNVLETFGMADCKPVGTPLCTGYVDKPADKEEPLPDVPFRELLGSLLYAATMTRPDISAAVSILSRRMQHFGMDHWKAAKHLLRYIKGTLSYTIKYAATGDASNGSTADGVLSAYSDASFASDVDTRRSRTGFVVFCSTGPVSWNSKLQATVATASADAEYMALAATAQELMFLRQLQEELTGAVLV